MKDDADHDVGLLVRVEHEMRLKPEATKVRCDLLDTPTHLREGCKQIERSLQS